MPSSLFRLNDLFGLTLSAIADIASVVFERITSKGCSRVLTSSSDISTQLLILPCPSLFCPSEASVTVTLYLAQPSYVAVELLFRASVAPPPPSLRPFPSWRCDISHSALILLLLLHITDSPHHPALSPTRNRETARLVFL